MEPPLLVSTISASSSPRPPLRATTTTSSPSGGCGHTEPCIYHYWQAGASQHSRTTGTIFYTYLFISNRRCGIFRNVLRRFQFCEPSIFRVQNAVCVRAFLAGCGAVCEHKLVHQDAHRCVG